MQLTVLKSDGSEEVYRHTKVLGTIAAALSDSGQYQPGVADELAEAVTLYLRHQYGNGRVGFDEIYAMLQAVLTETGYEEAALCLHDHRVNRQIKRGRIEIVHLRTAPTLVPAPKPEAWERAVWSERQVSPWNKSVIVRDLVRQGRIDDDLARNVASAVEEVVFRMGCRAVSSGVVRELVTQELLVVEGAVQTLEESIASFATTESAPVAAAC